MTRDMSYTTIDSNTGGRARVAQKSNRLDVEKKQLIQNVNSFSDELQQQLITVAQS